MPRIPSLTNDELNLEPYVELRRHLHTLPEIGGDTPDTAALVADRLELLGYTVHRGIGGNGLVATLRLGDGPGTLGLRADMDALPISEKNNFAHASQVPGRMHACGHDGHTAILLAAAARIAARKNFNGTLNLIFQPDEEGLTGAKAMIDDNLFERFPCDSVFALHNMPGLPLGQCIVPMGPTMASSQRVNLLIKGRGGHGAMPETTVDPLPALASLMSALQTIKSRNLAVDDYAVLSIGAVHAGTAYNIIPDEASLLLTVRTDTQVTLERINARIRELCSGHELAFGVTIEVQTTQLAPPLVNSQAETLLVREVLRPLVGEHDLLHALPSKAMGTEDFAYMLRERPGCYFLLGNGTGEYHGCSVHNPHYDFNDALIEFGSQCWVELTEHYLR